LEVKQTFILNRRATMNTIYTTQTCPWCQRAKVQLDKEGIAYTEVDVSTDRELQIEMIKRSGRQSVPQIFFAEEHIGGYDDLLAHLQGEKTAA
jgi:glutaredoxin 3